MARLPSKVGAIRESCFQLMCLKGRHWKLVHALWGKCAILKIVILIADLLYVLLSSELHYIISLLFWFTNCTDSWVSGIHNYLKQRYLYRGISGLLTVLYNFFSQSESQKDMLKNTLCLNAACEFFSSLKIAAIEAPPPNSDWTVSQQLLLRFLLVCYLCR